MCKKDYRNMVFLKEHVETVQEIKLTFICSKFILTFIGEGCQPLTRNDESDEKWIINGEFGEKMQ